MSSIHDSHLIAGFLIPCSTAQRIICTPVTASHTECATPGRVRLRRQIRHSMSVRRGRPRIINNRSVARAARGHPSLFSSLLPLSAANRCSLLNFLNLSCIPGASKCPNQRQRVRPGMPSSAPLSPPAQRYVCFRRPIWCLIVVRLQCRIRQKSQRRVCSSRESSCAMDTKRSTRTHSMQLGRPFELRVYVVSSVALQQLMPTRCVPPCQSKHRSIDGPARRSFKCPF